MATKVSLKFACASILSTLILLSEISEASKIIQRMETTVRRRELLESTVLRYLREIHLHHSPPFVHFILESIKDDAYKSRETIVKTCANFGISVSLLHPEVSPKIPWIQQGHPKIRYALAISRDISGLQAKRWKEIYYTAWKSGALFAIFIESERLDEESAKTLLKDFWDVDCSNVVLMSLNSSTENNSKIYSYNPFSVDKNGENGTLYEVGSTEPLFPDKLKDLRGQPITISLYRHRPSANLMAGEGFATATGMDVELIRYASRRLNFTVNLLTRDVDAASYVSHLPSGRSMGATGDVLTNRSEYLGNSRSLEVVHAFNMSLDFVYPYWRSSNVVIVRRALPLPAFFYLIVRADTANAFYIPTLILICLYLYLKFLKHSKNILLTILGLVIFQHLSKIGTRTSDRLFCIAIIYSSFVMCMVYQGYLVHALTAPPIFPNIDTLADLADQESLTLMVKGFELRILNCARSGETKQRLAEVARVELNFTDCVMQLKKSANVACSVDESFGKFAISELRKRQLSNTFQEWKDTDHIPPLHSVKESLIDFWQTYVMRKGFPYLRKINVAMGRAFEFGLTDKWLRDDRNKRFHQPLESKEPQPLSTLHLDYTFSILIIGNFSAIIVFVCEIVVAKGWLKNFVKNVYRLIRENIRRFQNRLWIRL